MPWFSFLQPIETWNNNDEMMPEERANPETWQLIMQEPNTDGWPSNQTNVPIISESAYLNCNESFVENFCYDELKKRADEIDPFLDPAQSEIAYCVAANLNRCIEVLTEDLPYQNGWLHVRACDVDIISCSRWSKPTVVSEPSFTLTLLVVMLCIAIFRMLKNKKPPTPKREGL
jgi:hypothetical protein